MLVMFLYYYYFVYHICVKQLHIFGVEELTPEMSLWANFYYIVNYIL